MQVGDGKAYVTGYFEPEIAGCRAAAGCETPLYKRPQRPHRGRSRPVQRQPQGRRIRGKVNGTSFIPYDERGTDHLGALAGRAPELAYANDPVALFFLEIQGIGPPQAAGRIG